MMSCSQRTPGMGPRKPALAIAFAGAILTLAGCSSTVDMIPEKLGGLPANTPQRQKNPPAYPAIFETPPPRTTPPLTAEERKRLEAELATTREEQVKKGGGPAPAPATPSPAKDPK